MKAENIISDYLDNLYKITKNSQFGDFYKWLFENGELFKERNTQLENKIFDDNKHFVKQCFYNSAINIINDTNLKYYEGYYVTENLLLPLKHAWNVLDGKVIDTTAKAGNFNVTLYFGVEIPYADRLLDYENANSYLDPLEWYYINKIAKNDN